MHKSSQKLYSDMQYIVRSKKKKHVQLEYLEWNILY